MLIRIRYHGVEDLETEVVDLEGRIAHNPSVAAGCYEEYNDVFRRYGGSI